MIENKAVVAAAILLGGVNAWAATEVSRGEPSAAAGEEVVRMDAFRTDAQRPEETEFSGDLFGTRGPASRIARSVGAINRASLDDLAVRTVEGLSPLIAGAVDAPIYGIAGVPTLRGELGDAAQNGQRRAFNRNVFPISFNGVEAVEAISGAPSPVFGYTSGAGGLVNFVTKRASFARAGLAIGATAGSWDERRWQVDANMPVSSGFAARLSVEGVDSGSFYRLAGERSLDVFLAASWRPSREMQWDLSVERLDADYFENPGTNRPTQALIDRGEYITGTSVQNGGTGRFFGNTFAPTGTVRIDGSQVLIAPGDGAFARNWTAQLIGRIRGAGGARITSRTYFEDVESEKHSAYRFYSYVPLSRTAEQRIEVAEDREWFGRPHSIVWGGSVRAEERKVFVEFLNEAMNAFDLTLDPDTFRYPVDRLFAVLPVPGRPGMFAQSGARYGNPQSVGISQTLHSRLIAGGMFAQDQIQMGRSVELTIGARADVVSAQTEDPLPRPGFAPVRDGMMAVLPAGSLSLSWKASERLSLYATLNDAAAVESSSSSGGFGLSNNRLPNELFENRSRMVEVGAKASTVDGRLSGAIAAFAQRRHRMNPRLGLPDEVDVRGVELSGAVRAARWEVSGNAAYIDAHYVDGPLPGGIATVPGFDPAVPSGSFGSYARGNYRLPGQPRWIANLRAQVRVVTGLTLRVWGRFEDEQNLDLFGRVRIPAHQTWNAGITWRRAGFEFRADFMNLTDEFNWRPTSTPFAGGDLVTRELPRHWRTSVRYEF